MVRPGKRLIPRHVEYRLTNSAASRAYFETAASPKTLMMLGMKHSLCFTSIVSKAQPSLSIPTKNSCVFRNSRRGVCGSTGTDMRLPFRVGSGQASSQIVVVDGGVVQAPPSPRSGSGSALGAGHAVRRIGEPRGRGRSATDRGWPRPGPEPTRRRG